MISLKGKNLLSITYTPFQEEISAQEIKLEFTKVVYLLLNGGK